MEATIPKRRPSYGQGWWRSLVSLDHAVIVVAVLALGVLVLFPLVMLLLQALFPAGMLPLQVFVEAFQTPSNYQAIADSVTVGVVVCLTAGVVGLALAILMNRTDLRGRRLFEALIWVNFFTPSYLVSLGWIALMQRGGFLDLVLGHTNPFASSFFSPGGIILVLTFKLFPFVYISAGAAVHMIGAEHEEAARVAGARGWHIWSRIVIPLLRPAILAGLILVFAEVISDFGIAATIGQQSGFPLMTLAVYDYVAVYPINYPMATAMSTFLVVSMGLALGLQGLMLRRRSFQVISGRAHRTSKVPLGRWQVPAVDFAVVVFVFALGAPFSAVLVMSFMGNIGRGLVASNFGIQNYQAMIATAQLGVGALWRSVYLSLAAATFTTMLSVVLTYVIYRWRGLSRAVLNQLTVVSMVVPSIVMAAGYVFAFNQTWLYNLGIALYGTMFLLLLSYIGQQISMAVRLNLSGVQQISVSLIDAAQVAGAGTVSVLARVVIPLMRKSLVSVWLLTFVITMFDLAMSEMLYPPGQPTLGVALVKDFGDLGNVGVGTAQMMLAISIVLVVVLVVNLVFKGGVSGAGLPGQATGD